MAFLYYLRIIKSVHEGVPRPTARGVDQNRNLHKVTKRRSSQSKEISPKIC